IWDTYLCRRDVSNGSVTDGHQIEQCPTELHQALRFGLCCPCYGASERCGTDDLPTVHKAPPRLPGECCRPNRWRRGDRLAVVPPWNLRANWPLYRIV